MRTRALVAGVLVVLGAAALPLVATRDGAGSGPRCSRDGVALGDLLRVHVETRDGLRQSYCCVRCAEDAIGRAEDEVLRVLVTDEPSGREIDARDAWFVWSKVETSRATGEHVHAFADRAAAEAHARAFGGFLLEGEDRPFRRLGLRGS